MFADDANAFLSQNSLETLFDIMNSELEKLQNRLIIINKQSLNTNEINYILFWSPKTEQNDTTLYVKIINIAQSQTS